MQVSEHIALVEREGQLLAEAAERVSLDTPVPTCPDWQVRDLVRHVGGIHSWATTIVREARPKPYDPYRELEANWPSDTDLLNWFKKGHAALVQTLTEAPETLECFAFLPAPSPRAFWARRQAHETGMHRVDAEGALGSVSPFATTQAVDGIEELLFGFLARPGQKLRSETPRSLVLETTDANQHQWLVRLGPDEPVVSREQSDSADCRVRAEASDLFRLLWNRRSPDGLDVSGDASLLNLWRETVFVRWR